MPRAGSAAEKLNGAVDAYLAHVQAQPTSWRALLAARTGDAGAIADEVERRSHEFILQTLGVQTASPGLQIALAGWSAFERDACLTWLDNPDLDPPQLKELLYSTFTAALTAVADRGDPPLDRPREQSLPPPLSCAIDLEGVPA